MTVKELKKQLEKFDDDAEIMVAVLDIECSICYSGSDIRPYLCLNGSTVQITIDNETKDQSKWADQS